MAVAFDAVSTQSEAAGDGVISTTHTPAGSTNLGAFGGVGWSFSDGFTSTTCKYAGTSMTKLWDITDSGAWTANAGHHWPGGSTLPGGAQTVESTLSGSPRVGHAMVMETLTGVHQTTPVGTAATATGGATQATVTVGSVGTDDLVCDALVEQSSSNPSADAGQTTRGQLVIPGTSSHLSCSTQPGTSGGVMSWTLTAPDFWTLGAVAFKPAAAGATTTDFMVAARQFMDTGGMVGREYV